MKRDKMVVGKVVFTDVETAGGAYKSTMVLTAKLDGVGIELTSYKRGPLEVYKEYSDTPGLWSFVGYLTRLEETEDVYGRPFPGDMLRTLWLEAWKTKAAREVLENPRIPENLRGNEYLLGSELGRK